MRDRHPAPDGFLGQRNHFPFLSGNSRCQKISASGESADVPTRTAKHAANHGVFMCASHEYFSGLIIYSHILSRDFRYSVLMEKYPYLNEAIASVLRKKREELGMSKRKLSELAMIERAYITGLEAGKWNATVNVLFYLSESLEMDPVDFVSLICKEMEKLREEEAKSPPVRRA